MEKEIFHWDGTRLKMKVQHITTVEFNLQLERYML